MEILSPVNGATATGTTIQVEVRFSAKLNPKGQPSGNVKRVELKVNGVVVGSYQNPPSVKTGTVTFVVDLTPYGMSTITLQAFAFQGSGGSAAMGTSTATALILGSPDQTPPTISNPTPPPGALRSQAEVEIRADLGDADSGVDPAATRLFLNASEVLSGVTRTSSSVSHAASGLTEGVQRVRVVAADVRGNPAEREWEFGVDLTDPFVAFTEPGAGAIVGTGRPIVRFEFFDPAPGGFGAGIDPAAGVQLTEDGRDVSAELSFAGGIATYQPPADRPLSQGPHVFAARVEDRSGRNAQAERSIGVNLEPPHVAILSPAPGTTTNYAPTFSFLFDGPSGALPAFARINGVDVLGLFEIQFGFLARYEPVLSDLVFLVPGVNVFEVGVMDGFGRVGAASIEMFLDRTSAPATVVPVIELREGGDQQVVSRRCSGDIVVVTRVGPEGRTVGDVRIEVGAPHGLILPGEVFGFVSNPDGNAGFHYQPEATTGLADVEAVTLSVSAPDFPNAEPLAVPVSVYFPQSIEVEVVRPFVAPDATFDPTVLVGSSSPIVFARLMDPRGGLRLVDTVLRYEIGRMVDGEFVEDASLGQWVPREARSETDFPTGFSSHVRSALFAVVATPAGEDPYTVRISAPEYPEAAARTYPVRFEAETTFRLGVSTPGADSVTADLPIGSIFKSGNAAVTAVGGSEGEVVLNLAPLRAALNSALPDEPASFGIRFVLGDTVFVLSGAPGTLVGDVDVATFKVPPGEVKFILVDVVGSSRDPVTGTEASVSFRDLGSRGVTEVRVVHPTTLAGRRAIPTLGVFDVDWRLAPRKEEDEFLVESRQPLGGPDSLQLEIESMGPCREAMALDALAVGSGRQSLTLIKQSPAAARFTVYRSGRLQATTEVRPTEIGALELPSDRTIQHADPRGFVQVGGPTSGLVPTASVYLVGMDGLVRRDIPLFHPDSGHGRGPAIVEHPLLAPGEVVLDVHLPRLDPGTVDSLSLVARRAESNSDLFALFNETGVDTRTFAGPAGSLTILGTPEFSPAVADVVSVRFTSAAMGVADLGLNLAETGPDSRAFTNGTRVTGEADVPPTLPDLERFRIELRNVDLVDPAPTVHLETASESTTVALERIHAGLYRSVPLVAVDDRMTAALSGLPLTGVRVITTRPSRSGSMDLRVVGSDFKGRTYAIALLFHSLVDSTFLGMDRKEQALGDNNLSIVDKCFKGALGYTTHADNSLNQIEATGNLEFGVVWYSLTHGLANLNNLVAGEPEFLGIGLINVNPADKEADILRPAEVTIPTARGTIDYDLVFVNGCESAQSTTGSASPYAATTVVSGFITGFNTKCYIGWLHSVKMPIAAQFARILCGRLDGMTPVQTAFDRTVAEMRADFLVGSFLDDGGPHIQAARGQDLAQLIVDRTK